MRSELDPDHWCNGGEYDSPHPDALAMQALDDENKKLRAEIERLRDERRWIPVEERLPEEGVHVLIAQKNGYQNVDLRRRDTKQWSTGAKITHWMPLPPLPSEEVQGDET